MKLFQSRKFPSWGYEVEQGATTVWEHWDSYTKAHEFEGEDGNQNASMNSFSHYSFGAVGEWMLGDLAGIRSDGSGYKKIIICPAPPTPDAIQQGAPIDWVNAHYDSIRGRIVSNWRITKGSFELKIEVPPNTTATVILPAIGADGVFESGRPLSKVKGVRFQRMTGRNAMLVVQSGVYNFSSKCGR
jgi:alpha-L-rhamnosidase